ncbi:MAG: ABC transporter permease subunit, partial [Eubacteriaceae bacterium]|nr:ABC transporter permease subunit [Eubacteriaceae bacterium]
MSFFELLVETWPRLLDGLLVTVEATIISLLIAAVLGIIFGLMSVSRNRILKIISRIYVDIIRGTPLIVQAFFIYFGLTSALDIRMEAITAGIITLSLNAGAYTAELFRAGIQSVPKG